MGLNAYSGMLTVVTGLNSLFAIRPTPALRITSILLLAAIWVGVTFSITADAISLLFATLTLMLYFLAPWTSVNLTDYFFVRRGHYAVTHLFTPDGIYGAWGGRGLIAYGVGLVASIPFFVVPDLYVGPAAQAIGGVDIGWLIGLVLSGLTYIVLFRSFDPSREAAAIRESEASLPR
jgi:purine-cytosine permease-like protein